MGAAEVNGKIYAFNGSTDLYYDPPLYPAECYDPATNKWTPIAPNYLNAFTTGVRKYPVFLL